MNEIHKFNSKKVGGSEFFKTGEQSSENKMKQKKMKPVCRWRRKQELSSSDDYEGTTKESPTFSLTHRQYRPKVTTEENIPIIYPIFTNIIIKLFST